MLFKRIIIVIIVSAIVTAACRTEQCINAPIALSFISFPTMATDSIVLQQYLKNSDFDSLVKSTTITKATGNYNQSGDTLIIGSYLDADYDYTLLMPAVNKTYKISNIVIEQKEVHTGLSMDKLQCLNPVKSYTLNGQLVHTDSYFFYLHY